MRKFDAVIFDMDGTLIEQALDFQAIRAELGIPQSEGILEAIAQMPPDLAGRVSQMLLERELEAARNALLLPGARQILRRIEDSEMKTALLTRNAQESMETVIDRFQLRFDLAWSREDAPIKPAPDGILRACSELLVHPERTCCVGDFYYDVVAANAAGTTSVLLLTHGDREFADLADHVITELTQLAEILGLKNVDNNI